MNDCIFCKIAKGDERNLLYKDDKVVVFKSIEPVADQHLLIVPAKHIDNFMNLDDVILSMTKVAQKMIKELNISDAYKVIFNGGKYQEIMHIHWHLLGGKIKSNI